MFTKKITESKLPSVDKRHRSFLMDGGKNIGRQKGFTLIEVVATLLIVGILAVLGGMAIVQTVNGYMTVKQNSATTQKYQMAMSRINREITEMINISSAASNTVIPITGTSNCAGTDCVRTIGLNNGAIKIASGSGTSLANGDILLDNVTGFNIAYCQGSDTSAGTVTCSSSWSTGNDQNLSAVKVTVTTADSSQTRIEVIAPRNNGNLGGATPPSSATSARPSGWGCFVATAAYGNAAHPMVQILREFRDKHLIHWPGGPWFVGKYYQYGPAAADMIRNRPVVMWAVRCLLAPFVAFAFCLMYVPLAIPFITFLSVMITVVLFAVLRKGFPDRFAAIRSRGSILIGLIITMVIMAVLAAAMLPIFSSSYMNQVYADLGRKAYYMAESGLRYAAYNYRYATTDAAKDQSLTDMNNRTYNLPNSGSFTTVMYPLWFNTTANTSSGAASVAANVPGVMPSEFSGSSFGGYLQVKSYSSSNSSAIGYYSYSAFSVSGTTITFSGLSASAPTSSSFPATTYPVILLPMAKTTQVSLTKGGNLTLNATGAGAFPLYNGSFTLIKASDTTGTQINVNSLATVFSYKTRVGSTLYNVTITDANQNTNWTSTLSLPATTNVVLGKFLRIASTGTAGSISRTVTYNVPIGWMTGGSVFQKQHFIDTMDNGSANWFASSSQKMGNQSFSAGVMQVTSMYNPSGGILGWLAWLLGWTCGSWNIIEWNWSNTSTNLAQAWMDAQGFTIYDLQVKVNNTQPYFFAGMNFRGRASSDDSDFYTYGVSFIRPKQTGYCVWGLLGGCGDWGWDIPSDECSDLIPNALFSGSMETTSIYYSFPAWYRDRYGSPAIILWKRTSSGFTWIAYRTLTAADGILTGSSPNFRLAPWSTLMVRVSEGYSLAFSNGNTSTPIKEGDTICNSVDCSGASARVVMTPILTAGSWTSGAPAAGILVLANISGSFANNNPLYVSGTQLAKASAAIDTTKRNYIRVYFTGTSGQGTANAVETDNNRLANPRDSANWPPDPLTDLNASNDYVTLVQWTGYNGVSAMTSTSEPNAIIVTTDLVSPTWTTSSTTSSFVGPDGASAGDNIGLVTGYSSGTSTYYDDFAAQLDLKSGTGFLTPIQQ